MRVWTNHMQKKACMLVKLTSLHVACADLDVNPSWNHVLGTISSWPYLYEKETYDPSAIFDGIAKSSVAVILYSVPVFYVFLVRLDSKKANVWTHRSKIDIGKFSKIIWGIANRGGGWIFDIGVGCFETAVADLTHSKRSKQAIK